MKLATLVSRPPVTVPHTCTVPANFSDKVHDYYLAALATCVSWMLLTALRLALCYITHFCPLHFLFCFKSNIISYCSLWKEDSVKGNPFCSILLTVRPNITIVFFTNLMHKFFISIHLLHSSTCFEHYCAHLQEDSCISTASGIVTVFRWLFSTQVKRLLSEQSPKESDDTRCCTNTIWPPEDEHNSARNM